MSISTTTQLFSHLNPNQRCAVEHFCGPLLVVAGAGSGKTSTLTYRIANLILQHRVNPENILAVTFTNKAAREMKERVQNLFSEQLALLDYGEKLNFLPEYEKTKIKSRVWHNYIKEMWIGTFHSLFARILRFDIEKYQDEQGRKWNRNFSIFDESDSQTLVKEIVSKKLNLDDKKFDFRSVRYAISNAKNQGFSPGELELECNDYKGRVIAQVYSHYQDKLAENNALDFDDLILLPARLFQQNEQVLGYWHQKFHHVLVDEYQDTNRTQYQLIQQLVTNGERKKNNRNWNHRSVFVVGDADQSVYSFRMADFTILLEFQRDFGDGLADEYTSTMVKLEENYRSCANILQAANGLIENNTQRIDKILKATKGSGESICCHTADDEVAEAQFVINQIRTLEDQNPELDWMSFAILYRTNAQSRPFEDILVRLGIPYTVVGSLKFYDRKEIKDVLAYLRFIVNPSDMVSLLRIINTPRRGIGKTTINNLVNAAHELKKPLWEVLVDEISVNNLAGRASKSIKNFVQMVINWRREIGILSVSKLVKQILESSGYIDSLKDHGTDEAENRLQNVRELFNAVLQFEEENEEVSLENFLASTALNSNLDDLKDGDSAISLMTLHASKGLEFPIVFVIGLEQGLFPNYRSMNDPMALEEERRLCYVGITRAQDRLYLSHAKERRLYGYREPALRSQFLNELPEDLLVTQFCKSQKDTKNTFLPRSSDISNYASMPCWKVGNKVLHRTFGMGKITHVFGEGDKISLAVKFDHLGQKIVNPLQLQQVN